jgi:DNA repair protein RecO (recombination protein O)
MEIYNTGSARGNNMDKNASYWDELLGQGKIIWGVAADDSHSPGSTCGSWVMVNSENNVNAILDALKAGEFYSSCGPEIYDFYVEDGKAVIECSPVSAICLQSDAQPTRITRGTDGLITRIHEIGAADKLINLITPEKGRIGVMVKGGKSPNSKTTPISQLFTYGNFEIYEKNSMYWLRGGSVINSFYGLSGDIARVALATYLCELANELTDEDEDCSEILRLLLNSLYLVSRGEKSQEIIKSVFEMRAAAISGYLPELFGCAYCHADFSDYLYLDVMGGKIVCTECQAKRGQRIPRVSKEFDADPEVSVLCGISPSTLAALRHIVSASEKKIFSFALKDDDDMRDLSRACEAYILNHLGRSFDSLDFYKMVR